MSSPQPFQHLTVIGLGLIGGSLAVAARERFPELQIHAVDPKAETLQYALRNGIVDTVSLALPDDFAADHLIIIAAHLNASLEILKSLSQRIQPDEDILVSDIGSCKRKIYDVGLNCLPEQFIAGHPMAGKELSGIEHATGLLFAGKTYILCPPQTVLPTRLQRLEALLSGIGAKVKQLADRDGAERHDRIMAYVSHFPQFYAMVYANLLYENRPGELLSFQGGGMDDQMRLAGSSPTMWQDIFEHNRDNLDTVLSRFQQLINDTRQNPDELALRFKAANAMYQDWQAFKRNPVL